jgi:serine/threonine protein phosphatase PrpC
MMMNYSFCALSDAGLVRTNNEDSFALDEKSGVAVLADGMGGYNAGEVASGMATTFIKGELVRRLNSSPQPRSLEQIARDIESLTSRSNQLILNAATSDVQCIGMGTTVVTAVFQGDSLILGHVGDSRCYRLRQGLLAQITKDHSMLQEQVDAGVLTPEQAAVAPGKNLLTRALGVEDTVKVDVFRHAVEAGDIYLLCSDGLTDMLDLSDMAQALALDAPLQGMASALVEQAKANGGRDNITVVLVQAAAWRRRRIDRLSPKPYTSATGGVHAQGVRATGWCCPQGSRADSGPHHPGPQTI